ncbi:MAG: hypothetical protein IKJ26_05060 [Clostridia bacterium]|nr:hypothetical protein [Clostridia bacterium]
MSCYGREYAYFDSKDNRFLNCVWIELIGFDNTNEDYGVDRFIETAGYMPDIVSFHLSSVDFVNTHQGMEKECVLPIYACSYGGHTHNDDRERQDWTNWQMKGLVDALHARGVRVFFSLFDLEFPAGREHLPNLFTDNHPELRCVDLNGNVHSFIYMPKRFKDGTPFVDFLRPRLIQTVNDYGVDGVQIADGLSSPRMSLEHAEFSDDIVLRFFEDTGITPDAEAAGCCDGNKEAIFARANWICKNHRMQWGRWMMKQWSGFTCELIRALKENGTLSAFNSAWTKDPTESMFRYGTDYVALEKAGAHNFVVEDVSADLQILGADGQGFNISDARRRYVHYEFAANLMCNKAAMPNLKMTPLSMIRDTLEQWDVLHHMPTAMQRAAATNLNNYLVTPDGFTPVTNGPWFCLGDGLDAHEWRDVRMAWDNGYTPQVRNVPGYTMIWSNAKSLNEVGAMAADREWITAKWLGELKAKGAPLFKIAPIEYLDAVSGPIVVANPDLLPQEERAKIDAYDRGRVLYVGALPQGKAHEDCLFVSVNEWKTIAAWTDQPAEHVAVYSVPGGKPANLGCLPELRESWRHEMTYHPVAAELIEQLAKWMETDCDYPTLTMTCENYFTSDGNHAESAEDEGFCHVEQVEMTENKDRFLIENEAYFYCMPVLHVKRPIEKVEFLTKPVGYPAPTTEYTVSSSVPGRGMDVLEITYKE